MALSIKIGPVALATGRFERAAPTPEGAKLVFALDGKPSATVTGDVKSMEAMLVALQEALKQHRALKGGG